MEIIKDIQDGMRKVELLRQREPLYQDPMKNFCPTEICLLVGQLSSLNIAVCSHISMNAVNSNDIRGYETGSIGLNGGSSDITVVASVLTRLKCKFDSSKAQYCRAQEGLREAVKASLQLSANGDDQKSVEGTSVTKVDLHRLKFIRDERRRDMFKAGQCFMEPKYITKLTQLLDLFRTVDTQFKSYPNLILQEGSSGGKFALGSIRMALDSVLSLVDTWEKKTKVIKASVNNTVTTKATLTRLGELLCQWGNFIQGNVPENPLSPLDSSWIMKEATTAKIALQTEIEFWDKDPMADFPLEALMDLYPSIHSAIPIIERVSKHVESMCALIKPEIESIEPWATGQSPEFKALSALKNDLNAKKTGLKYQLMQARHNVEMAEAELDDDVVDSVELRKLRELQQVEAGIKLAIHHNKRQQSHQRALMAKIAEVHFPELLLEHPELRLFADNLGDIASGFFIPERTLADYHHLDRLFFPASRHILLRGSYGGQLVVLKEYSFTSSAQMRSIQKEARLLAQHVCEHIVKANCILVDGLKAYIEMPFYSNGSMDKFLEKQGKDLSELTKRVMLRKVCCAIQYLHSRQIVHGDIKLENILIANDGMPLLADFDICRELNINGAITATTTITGARGTVFYMAPELFVDGMHQSSKSSDMYAFCICILLVMGFLPSRSHFTSVHTVDSVIGDANLKFIVDRLLQLLDPPRLTASKVLNSDYFIGVEAEAFTLAHSVEKRMKEVQAEADVKLAAEIAEAQMRQRSCCICGDEVDMSDGVECKLEDRAHFTCNECFDNNVKSFATKPLGSRRWMKVWNHKKSCEQIIQCTEEAIRKEFDIQGDGQNKPFPSLHSDTFEQFSHLFQPLDTYKKQLCVFCPMHGHGCNCEPISEHDIMMHITPAVLAQYQRSRDELMEWRLTAEFEERMRVDRARMAALSAEERRVLEIKHHVVENILNLRCPRADCRQVFVDFNGCFALQCSRCSCGFCAYCLEDCGRDAHAHVAACPHNTARVTAQGRDYFASVENFDAAQKVRRRRMFDEYLATLDRKLQLLVSASLQRELQDLGLL